MAELIRQLKVTVPLMSGLDIEGWAGGAHRYLETGELGEFRAKPARVRRTFGPGKRDLAKRCAKKARLPEYGIVGPALMEAMTKARAFDSLSELQIDTYNRVHAPPTIVYPHAAGPRSTVCQGLHETLGISGNWAIDFCAPGGTFVVAVEDARIDRLSGRDPALPPDNLAGIWGWSIYYVTRQGYRYFSTHYGSRTVHEGQRVKAGHIVGRVGSWPFDAGRSHTHLGVASPYGERDARKRILAVSRAPRVTVGD